jgi:hypothetical protein
MKEPVLLFLNAIFYFALGFLLLLFPFGLVGALGAALPGVTFYASMLGAVLLGIGLALMLERSRGILGLPGLGINGAILINISCAITLALWLFYRSLNLLQIGYILLWGLAAMLVTITLAEIYYILQEKRMENALKARSSQITKGQSHLGKAIAIAAQAHQDQKDRAGLPYILHPLRVMQKMDNDNEKIAATLHDVVESTSWTLDQLKTAGFSSEVLKIVERLSREDEEPYESYIDRVSEDCTATKIKLADLEDNMDLRRLPELTEENLIWLKEYHRFWLALQQSHNGSKINGNGHKL